MELVFTIVVSIIAVYVSLLAYLFERFRRLRRLPPEERRKMTGAQRVLYLYGFYRLPVNDLQSTASRSLSAFHEAWREMGNVFQQFETTFENRKQELQVAEQNLTGLQQEIQEQNERLQALKQLTPEAAREVSEAILRSSRGSLRQQIIISAVFFVLGSVTTLGITILVVS